MPPSNDAYPLAGVYDAIHQLREYRDFFEDPRVRRGFYRVHGFQAYRPKVTVIMGRSSDCLDYVQRVRLGESLARQFNVMTWDDILALARRRQLALE